MEGLIASSLKNVKRGGNPEFTMTTQKELKAFKDEPATTTKRRNGSGAKR